MAETTFSEHVAPIIFSNCSKCHRPGEAAPFSLLTYDDVLRRARQIVQVTRIGYMPPWKAESSTYAYKDERRLAPEQIQVIADWYDGGMLEGDPDKLPPPPDFTVGWQLGTPDLVVQMPQGFAVPAEGPDVYRNFVVPLGLPEDKWIRAIELRPSARSAVHHVLYFSDSTGASKRQDAADDIPGFSGLGIGLTGVQLGGWALGQQPYAYSDGLALPLKKGADLVLQYHFHPTGKAEVEQSTIGLYFADRAPDRQLLTLQFPALFGVFARVDIPAGEPQYTKQTSWILPVDVEAVTVSAHAHYLGKRMELTAELPSGEQVTLLRISDWDFAWQDMYQFRDSVPLPKGTRLRANLMWDNSADNPRNPFSPPRRVRWGEQSTDEMGSLLMQVVPAKQSDYFTLESMYNLYILGSALGR